MYDINNIIPSMFEIEMVLAFSKLSHQKEIQPRKKKVPCSSFGTASRKNDPMPPKGSYLENVYSLYGEQANVASQPSTQKTKKERSSGFQSYLKGKENHVKCDSS